MTDYSKPVLSILKFLDLLEANNNREWFNSNKALYKDAYNEFEKIVEAVQSDVIAFDRTILPRKPKDSIFRIYNDTRFSKNKLPYKNHFGAFFSVGGRSGGLAGYYFHLQNNQSMVAGGVYMPPTNILNTIRKEIFFNHQKFSEIIENELFVNAIGSLDNLKLTRPPKGFPPNHPAIELAKYKSYIGSRIFSNDEILQPNFINLVSHTFLSMTPLIIFINDAIRLMHEE